MADVTVAAIEEMEPIYDGLARRARATLGVSSFGMHVMNLPPDWEGYPNHVHDSTVEDANQEEVYIPLHGSATLVADDERHELHPGVMIRVGPQQRRRILPGADGIRLIALGGIPGTFAPSPWTERGGPPPVPREADIRGVTGQTRPDAPALSAPARAGEERAFVELTTPHRAALHPHCYRLLGSCTTPTTRCRRRSCARGGASIGSSRVRRWRHGCTGSPRTCACG